MWPALFSQTNRYNENWKFGNYAGITFNGLNTGAVIGSAMASPQGVASISDAATGELLFYSNGEKVWGFNHQLIGSGDNLTGNADATQSALFVPFPKSGKYYYLFTVSSTGGSEGLSYSLIDSAIGFNGGIIPSMKNVQLATPVTEKITLLRHCDRMSYWVVGHEWGSNRFFAWRITEEGLDNNPVVTNTGPVYSGIPQNGAGYMKASRNDDMLALAVTGSNRVDIFGFDNLNGVPFFMYSIDNIFQPYGIEFSDDQTLLYVSSLTGEIWQYNLNAVNISGSGSVVGSTGKLTGALQVAPDGRIYITRDLDYFLGYIGSPNSFGSGCNYVQNGLYLSGRTSEAGLPPYIPLLDVHGLESFAICLGDTVSYDPSFLHRVDSFMFYFGDSLSPDYDSTSTVPAWHVFDKLGYNSVKLKYYMCEDEFSTTTYVCVQDQPGVYLGPDTAICDNTIYYLSGILSGIYCPTIGNSFLWNTGDTTSTLTINPPGQYSLTVTNVCGTASDTVTIESLPVPSVTTVPDITLCTGDTAIIIAFFDPADSLFWQDGSNDPLRYITTSGYFIATVINEYNCAASDDVLVTFIESPGVQWELRDTVICIGHAMELKAQPGFDSYVWQDGSTGTAILITDGGWYYVSVTNLCGTFTDSLFVGLEDCNLKLYVPNAFTPDGDGLNDVFRAYGQYIDNMRLSIFNRWGELLFYSDDIEYGWDGTSNGRPAQEGTYVWKITYRDATEKFHVLRGTVTLIRK